MKTRRKGKGGATERQPWQPFEQAHFRFFYLRCGTINGSAPSRRTDGWP